MASRGVNKVILVGNLGDDPIVRYMPNGNAVASLSVATSESWKDQQGQQQDRVEWHRVVIFGKLAEIAGEYLRKGSQVYLEGKLQTRKWQDNNGQDRYTTEVVVDMGGTMQMLGSRDQSQGQQNHSSGQQNRNNQNHNQGQSQQQRPRSNNQGGQGYAPKQNQVGNGQMQQQSQHQQQQNYTPDLDGGWDDDIPF